MLWRQRLKLMQAGIRLRVFSCLNDNMNKMMDDNMRYEGEGLYESPFLVVYMVEGEGVLCQSGGSTTDDLGLGESWEDKLWKD